MQPRHIRKFCKLDADSETLLERAMLKQGLSARAHDRILKVARTIADLSESENIEATHISEAINYRSLDRNYITETLFTELSAEVDEVCKMLMGFMEYLNTSVHRGQKFKGRT